MKVYLLWYNDWEENMVLGVFETKKEAENWKEYFIMYPSDDICCSMRGGDEVEDQAERKMRLEIEEVEIGKLNSGIKIDNLQYLEWQSSK
jgi:hypothetical protein